MNFTIRYTLIAILSCIALIGSVTPAAQANGGSPAEGTDRSAVTVMSPSERAIEEVLDKHTELGVREGPPVVVSAHSDGNLAVVMATGPEDQEEDGQVADGRVTIVARDVPLGERNASGRYESSEPTTGITTFVEPGGSGFRILTVVGADSSVRQFAYEAHQDGKRLSFIRTEDGAIHIGDGNAKEYTSFGAVDEPWAYDADGSVVETWYEISADGKTLIQNISPTAAAVYPLVADPAYTFWAGQLDCSWGSCTFYLERVKTYYLQDQIQQHGNQILLSVLYSTICSWVAVGFSLAGPAAYIATAVCAGFITAAYLSVASHIGPSRTWRCLTFKSYHWSTTIYVGHVSGSSSHCFYNV